MTEAREELRQTREEIRREQQKIAPGTGLLAVLDRAAWSATGAKKAGEWNWKGLFSGLATFALLAAFLIVVLKADETGLIGGLAGYGAVLARGRYLHNRYRRRRGDGEASGDRETPGDGKGADDGKGTDDGKGPGDGEGAGAGDGDG